MCVTERGYDLRYNKEVYKSVTTRYSTVSANASIGYRPTTWQQVGAETKART